MEVLNCLKHTTTFEETKAKLQELNLVVKEDSENDLYLVKYDKTKCDMSNSNVQKCRGLVARKSDNKLVCLPPIKSETFDTNNDWSQVQVEDFIDGTNINVFYHNDKWFFSTRSNIGANCRWSSNKYFSELFNESNNSINFDELDTTLFYSFVLLHPENIIVTKYTVPTIVLISVGKNDNGAYVNMPLTNIEGYSGPVPFVHTFSNYMQAVDYVSKLDFQFQGLVLKYGSNFERRSKIRNSNYNYVKCLKGNTNNLKYVFLESLQNKTTNEYLTFFPEYTNLFNEFNTELNTLVSNINNNYRLFHKKKAISIQEIPFQYRRLCYEIHGLYMENKQNVTYNIVYSYILSLPVPRILFSINYKS